MFSAGPSLSLWWLEAVCQTELQQLIPALQLYLPFHNRSPVGSVAACFKSLPPARSASRVCAQTGIKRSFLCIPQVGPRSGLVRLRRRCTQEQEVTAQVPEGLWSPGGKGCHLTPGVPYVLPQGWKLHTCLLHAQPAALLLIWKVLPAQT